MRLIPFLIAAVLLTSCDKKQAEVQQIKNVEAGENDSLLLPADSAVAAPVKNDTTAASTTGKPTLNPEHGQPYHRCDIPVGAPIDSAPQQASTMPAPQVVPAPQAGNFNTTPLAPGSAAPAPVASGAKPALNPPHGEPFHRCDLQVGAPLT